MTYLVGIDLGTEGVRVGLFDESGQQVGTASEAIRTSIPGSARAEQDPDEWWIALGRATRAVLAGVDSSGIGGLCVSTTSSTVVACTRLGIPLRPAIMWMDTRAWREAEDSKAIEHDVMRFSGGSDAAEWLAPKAAWLCRNEPEEYAKADYIVEALDFLNFRLTGEWASSLMNATCKANYDPIHRCYHSHIFSELGAEGLEGKLPDKIIRVGDPVGTLTPAAADHLGINGRPIVAQGGIDAHMAMLGGGHPHPGSVFMIAGTSNVQLALTEEILDIDGMWGPYPDALVPGLSLIEGGQISAGSILRWITRDLLQLPEDEAAKLAALPTVSPTGPSSLLVLDYWMGNRTPYRDDRLRGSVLGLSLNHSPADIYRAAVESIAFGTRNVLDSFEQAGLATDRVIVSGGIRHNPLWLQTTADVLGRPIEFCDESNLTTLAGAISAATALDRYDSLASASQSMGAQTRTVTPTPGTATGHDHKYALYLQATTALSNTLHDLVNLTEVR
jgi:FGGY-family pentulose kinase